MASIFRNGLFKEQVALVTGGASGIGFATALTLGDLGAKVALCGRNKDKLGEAEQKLRARGVDVFVDVCDIREPSQIASTMDAVQKHLGTISVLVNNAGGQFPTTAESLSTRGWEAVIRNNLNGTFFMTQAVALKHMIPAKKGRIVNVIANIARGFPGMIHTGAARAGVENMTKTLAIEWASHNIQVNSVAPGIIRTTGIDQYPPELIEASRQRTPMKRLGSPGEVAELIAYLACDAAHFVTGESWYIDGGAHLWGDHWTLTDDAQHVPPPLAAELAKSE